MSEKVTEEEPLKINISNYFQVERLKNELKTRETRWNSASHRFRSRINELEEANTELRNEVKILEEQRIERWKQHTNQQVNIIL